MARHVEREFARGSIHTVMIAGDFNQPFHGDYTEEEWEAMSRDMEGAKLALNDGVADMLRGDLFSEAFDGREVPVRPPSHA